MLACATACFALATAAVAQAPSAAPPYASVTVSASATTTVANDRLQAYMHAEADNADPAVAASAVNALTAKALARAKSVPSAKVATTSYSTQSILERGGASRWRVSQTISIEGSDFAAISRLVTQLQEQEGLVLSGMGFTVSNDARRQAEEAIVREALNNWKQRAGQAASGLGFSGWRVGHVSVQTNEPGRAQPMMRAAMAAPQGGTAPVAVEAGTTEVSVNVTGDAILEGARAQGR
jgi:predicted secreted protein